MIATAQAIYQNPTFTGHLLLGGVNYFSNRIKKASQELGFGEKHREAIQKILAELEKGPVTLGCEDVGLLYIRKDYKSDKSDLIGITFNCEVVKNGYRVAILKDNRNKKCGKCARWSSLIALVSLGVVTSPVTIPSAIVGMALKTSIYFCAKRTLSIRIIDPKDFPKMAAVARKWQSIAHDKVAATYKQKQAETKEQASVTSVQKEIFEDCARISKLVAQCFEGPKDCLGRVFHEAYVCRDNFGVDQGIILTRIDSGNIKIAHLVTHPHNVRSSLNHQELEKVSGVGTKLIKHIGLQCLKQQKKLYLEGTESSRPFYDCLGFEEVDEPYIEDGAYAMEMSTQKIKLLVAIRPECN
ncbi:MAG: GNAT family N-acetyltransferase [Parachlamydiaceae bacterium]|nr:GNAT family N-acetyltransferase [Parachlamydiaceae bacterium]